MIAGSGSMSKPWLATELNMVGLSWKIKSAPWLAPAASITAESMWRDVSLNSRSPVSSGPRSERASTVRNSLRKLFVSTAKTSGAVTRAHVERNTHTLRGEWHLLVSLVLNFCAEVTMLVLLFWVIVQK